MTSSFEKPNTNESFWSMTVISTSSGTSSDKVVASSSPANPAPRINTLFIATSIVRPGRPASPA